LVYDLQQHDKKDLRVTFEKNLLEHGLELEYDVFDETLARVSFTDHNQVRFTLYLTLEDFNKVLATRYTFIDVI